MFRCCKSSYLEELVIRRLGLELTAVLDGFLEIGSLGDHDDLLSRREVFGIGLVCRWKKEKGQMRGGVNQSRGLI